MAKCIFAVFVDIRTRLSRLLLYGDVLEKNECSIDEQSCGNITDRRLNLDVRIGDVGSRSRRDPMNRGVLR